CHPTLLAPNPGDPPPPLCTLWDLDPADGTVTKWAQTHHARLPFVDGIYFDPTGNYLFVANRLENDGNALTILRRPSAPVTATDDSQIVRDVLMTAEPDGVAFHDATPPATDRFVVTNDEFDGSNNIGTMTR